MRTVECVVCWQLLRHAAIALPRAFRSSPKGWRKRSPVAPDGITNLAAQANPRKCPFYDPQPYGSFSAKLSENVSVSLHSANREMIFHIFPSGIAFSHYTEWAYAAGGKDYNKERTKKRTVHERKVCHVVPKKWFATGTTIMLSLLRWECFSFSRPS